MTEIAGPWTDLSSIVTCARDAIVGETLDGTIAYWNEGATRLLGYPREEVLGKPSATLTVESGTDGRRRALEVIRSRDQVPIYEENFRCKNGDVIAGSVALSPVVNGAGHLIGLSRIVRLAAPPRLAAAVAHEKDADDLPRIARWGAIGQLAMVLAHEVIQPLTAIVIYLQAIRRLLPPDLAGATTLGTAVDRASGQSRRAAGMIRSFRSFVSPGPTARQALSLRTLVEEASEFGLIVARQAGVTVTFRFDADAPVLVHRAQIHQVLFNLMRNAVEAMADTALRELRISTSFSEGCIVVSVADTGSGVSADMAARLFQPFVTTKPDGMGVGLSICRSIIAAHGGRLWLDAEVPQGATFRFTLPRLSSIWL